MAAVDDFVGRAPLEPVSSAAVVAPSDTTDLTDVTRALFVGGAGNVAVVMKDGQSLTITGLTAGSFLPIRVSRVKAAGTTATNMVAFW